MTKKINLTLLFFALSFALLGLGNLAEAKSTEARLVYPGHPYPNYILKVVSPNGGEVWDRNIVQKIGWKVEKLFTGALESYPYPPRVSIDLFEEMETSGPDCKPGFECPPTLKTRVFVKHIGSANLFDGAYSWKITDDIQNGKNYIVRISSEDFGVAATATVQRPISNTEEARTVIWPSPVPVPPVYLVVDDSDGAFAIVGEITTPPPVKPDIKAVIAILEQMLVLLQKAIDLLK